MKTINVVAAIIQEGNRILATQRGHGDYKDGWEFPGGKIEGGETPEEALRREIREELELEIEVGTNLCTVDYDYPAFHLNMQCFWATIKTGTPVLKEHEAAKWLTRTELKSVAWLPADVQVVERILSPMEYHKLVRDRIPDIIRASGKTCMTEILADQEYLRMLDAKLDEELAEYHKDQNIEELADLLEVIRAAAVARGYTLEELERVRAEKAVKRGGFEKRILLKEVYED